MKNVIVSVLFVLMAVQIQLANAYAVYPALIPKVLSEPCCHGTIDYAPSPANYPDVAVAGPWTYLSISPVGQVVEQVPYILTNVPGFLSHQDAVASDLVVRTKRKNVLHYRNGEFRPILCSPRLCLIGRPMGESEE
ncbi:hypothetical protein DAPPUDRAFT_252952 [Daphnia pulex]|uniref:Uncharacterized protein n=1 Tax=Daphnia pulex TaxID=6669 RepID=E9H3V6_DAPPU|nr:hypothetical protein DAPPUDRAFT_252952 [Daphnia pulex]|eukprot:EFX73647.1 hypothetical protein DAPPUDRAFT_252952 [Daphnia pulex]